MHAAPRGTRSGSLDIAIGITAASLGVLLAIAPLTALALGVGCLALIAFWTAPAWCVAAVLLCRASLDTSGSLVTVAGTNAAGFVTLFVAICGGIALLRPAGIEPAPRTLASVALLGLAIAAGVIGVVRSPLPAEAISEVTRYASLAVVYFHVRRITLARVERRYVWLPIALGTAVPLLVAATQITTGTVVTKQGFDAVASTFTHPNGFAAYLFIVAVMLLAYPRDPGSSKLVARTLLPAVLFGALVATYARSAWAVALLAVIAVATTSRRMLAVGLLAGLLVVILIDPAVFTPLVSRFSDLSVGSSGYAGNSLAWREQLWHAMWPKTLDSPLIGHGLVSFPPAALATMGPRFGYVGDGPVAGLYAHNEYLNLSYQLGAVGVLVVLGTVASQIAHLRIGLQVCRRLTITTVSVALGLLVVAYTDNVLAYSGAMTYAAALFGLWAGTVIREQREVPVPLAGGGP